MILLWFFWTAILVAKLIGDTRTIRAGKSPRHGLSALFRSVAFAASSLVYCNTLPAAFVLCVFQLALFWVVFDMLLNSAMGWDLLFSGKTSALDRLLGMVGNTWEIVLKGLLLVGSGLCGILLYGL